jgi:hypothetical protein
MKQRRLTPIICAHCHGPGMAFTPDIARGYGIYCSRPCSNLGHRQPISERLEKYTDKIDHPQGCWIWSGTINRGGYGNCYVNKDGYRTTMQASRAWFEHVNGPIPPGLELDHLCRNRVCVNPSHLEPVTGRENTLRSEALTAKYARATHCKNGHPFTGDNLKIRSSSLNHRRCAKCSALNCKRYKAAIKLQAEVRS